MNGGKIINMPRNFQNFFSVASEYNTYCNMWIDKGAPQL